MLVIAIFICSGLIGGLQCDRGMVFDTWEDCYEYRFVLEQEKNLEAYCEEVDVTREEAE